MAAERVRWRTMAITDRRRLGDDPVEAEGLPAVLASYAAALAAAGVGAVQLREHDLPDGLLRRCAAAMTSAVAGGATAVLVNERAHVARVTGAAGVHLRASGMPARRVRPQLGPTALIGRSLHGTDHLASGEMKEVDYVLFGTVFPSASKAPDHPVAGLAGLASCCEQAGRPVLAVGGMTADNSRDVARHGATGVAAIGLFAEAWKRGAGALDEVVWQIEEAFRRAETDR